MINQLSNDFICFIEGTYIRILIEDMHKLKNSDHLHGDSCEKQYENFLDIYLNNLTYQRNIFDEYPVLLQILLDKIESFVEFINELINNLDNDKNIITSKICKGVNFCRIEEIKVGLSDEHIIGKTVTKIRLDNGCVLYYKPRSLESTVNYNKINIWLQQHCELDYYEHAVIDCGNYGWEREVLFKECSKEVKIERFYYRMGIQLCLAYILNVSDMHFENIIAHGEYPVFIDLEVFPDTQFAVRNENKGLHKFLENTVMNTGILPHNAWKQQVNVAALGDGEIQKSPFKLPQIGNQRTSEMYIYYDYSNISMTHNIPSLDGNRKSYESYIDFILRGFIKAYNTINLLKEEFIQLLNPVFKQKSRYLMRNTQEYTMYQNISCFPEMLRSSEHRYLALFRLDKGLQCPEKHRYQILKYEMYCIYHLCVPVYYVRERDLYLGDGTVIFEYFERSAKDIVTRKLDGLSDKDLEVQKKMILVSFLSTIKAKQVSLRSLGEFFRVPKFFTPETIMELIISNRLEHNSEMGWLGVCYGQKNNVFLAPVNMYLYDGMAGIAIFMTAISICSPCNKYTEFSKWITKKLFTYSNELISGLRDLKKCRWGLFTGEASLIYTYILLHRITNKAEYMLYAEKQSQFVIENLNMINETDLLDGKAGIVMVMTLMYEETGEQRYLNVAVQVADQLLSMYVSMEQGIGWLISGQSRPLAGLAHGNSGIALALSKLWEKTRESAYYKVLLQAINYENSLFDEAKGNWIDIRGGSEHILDTSGWCHGAPGILIARREIHKLKVVDTQDLFIKQALFKTQDTRSADACLCHGYCGIHEILEYCEPEGKMSLHIGELSVEDYINPGFMIGSSGIGYALLRESDPSLPNVICFK